MMICSPFLIGYIYNKKILVGRSIRDRGGMYGGMYIWRNVSWSCCLNKIFMDFVLFAVCFDQYLLYCLDMMSPISTLKCI